MKLNSYETNELCGKKTEEGEKRENMFHDVNRRQPNLVTWQKMSEPSRYRNGGVAIMCATPAVPYTTLETYNASVLSPLLPRVAHSPQP